MIRVRMTYLVASIALMVALPCLIGVLTPTPSAHGTWIALTVAGGIAAALLFREARRDSYPFAQFALVALLFPAAFAIAAYTVAESSEGRVRAVAGGAVCFVGIALAVRELWREHHAVDEGVNVLLQRFDRASIFETDGVQWGVIRGDGEVGEGAWVEVFVQSCVAALRLVTIQVEDVTGLLKRRGSLATPPLPPVRLAPGEVGALLVPVRAGPRPAAESSLYVSLRARGAPGRRRLHHRAQAASERTKLGFQLFAILGGTIVWGGGVRCVFHNPNERAGTGEAPAARWRSIGSGDG